MEKWAWDWVEAVKSFDKAFRQIGRFEKETGALEMGWVQLELVGVVPLVGIYDRGC